MWEILGLIGLAFVGWKTITFALGQFAPPLYTARAYLNTCLQRVGLDHRAFPPELLDICAQRAVGSAEAAKYLGQPFRQALADSVIFHSHVIYQAKIGKFDNFLFSGAWDQISEQYEKKFFK